MAIILTGDIHGDAFALESRLLDGNGELLVHEGDTLICLGDVGLLYGDYLMGDLRRLMSGLPCDVVIMRGNHDTRYCRDMRCGAFAGNRMRERDWCGGTVLYDKRHPNILYLPDEGGLFTVNDKNCLFVPGAFSVDGQWRQLHGYPFEPEEQLTAGEFGALLRLADSNRIDYVFSHTCPLLWEEHFRDLFLSGIKQSLVDKSMERWMNDLLDEVRPTLRGWYFGHFHDDREIPVDVTARMLFREPVWL